MKSLQTDGRTDRRRRTGYQKSSFEFSAQMESQKIKIPSTKTFIMLLLMPSKQNWNVSFSLAFLIFTNWVIGSLLVVVIEKPGFGKSSVFPDLSCVKLFHVDFETSDFSGKNVQRWISAEGETTIGPEIKSWFTERNKYNSI